MIQWNRFKYQIMNRRHCTMNVIQMQDSNLFTGFRGVSSRTIWDFTSDKHLMLIAFSTLLRVMVFCNSIWLHFYPWMTYQDVSVVFINIHRELFIWLFTSYAYNCTTTIKQITYGWEWFGSYFINLIDTESCWSLTVHVYIQGGLWHPQMWKCRYMWKGS